MNDELSRLRRHESALEEADGLIDELKSEALKRLDFDHQMQILEQSNPDLPVLSDARMDPTNDGRLVKKALVDVRRAITEINAGSKK